jgi:hypothetical protein
MNDPRTILLPFMMVVLGSALGCLWLGFRPIWRWKGPARWLGLVGAAPPLFSTTSLVVSTVRTGTTPNLWPFEMLLVSWAGLFLLAILYGARWWTRDERAGEVS